MFSRIPAFIPAGVPPPAVAVAVAVDAASAQVAGAPVGQDAARAASSVGQVTPRLAPADLLVHPAGLQVAGAAVVPGVHAGNFRQPCFRFRSEARGLHVLELFIISSIKIQKLCLIQMFTVNNNLKNGQAFQKTLKSVKLIYSPQNLNSAVSSHYLNVPFIF